MGRDKYWILDNRPHTRTKLQIFSDYFNVLLTIWNNQDWINKDWYYLDLFAGRGEYSYNKKKTPGTPILFLNQILNLLRKGKLTNVKIQMFMIEKDKYNATLLNKIIKEFILIHPEIAHTIQFKILNDDCNSVIDYVLENISNDRNNPLLTIIDPYGIKTTPAKTIKKITSLKNRQDIFFNYILEGVRRTVGIAKKVHLSEDKPRRQEIKTIETLHSFLGREIDTIKENNDLDLLEIYAREVLSSKTGNKIIAFDMPYPRKNDIIYYLLFACHNDNITRIVRDIYGRRKKKHIEESGQLTLFDSKYYEEYLLGFD